MFTSLIINENIPQCVAVLWLHAISELAQVKGFAWRVLFFNIYSGLIEIINVLIHFSFQL